jgi:ABC-type amino acid transport substrate-binding protein
MRRSRFSQIICLGLGMAIVTACSSQPSSQPSTKVWKVATEPAFAPFESKNAQGELVGFDIELLRAIGQITGNTIEFQSLPFDGIIPALQAGTVDGAVSAITITADRAKVVNFSRPYFKAGLAIAVKQDNTQIKSISDLKGKTIAVQLGTTGAKTAKAIPNSQVREFDSGPLALQELANGNVVAVINDAPVTLDAIKQGKLKGVKIIDQLVTEEYYGIALPKNSPHQAAIDSAIGQLIQNGEYSKLYQKWFPGQPPVLPTTIKQ